MDECVKYSHRLAERVGTQLEIPVYLYENSAKNPTRKNLAVIRDGEYEGLKKKLNDKQWKPDFGPTVFNAFSGATVIGCREFLIASQLFLPIDANILHTHPSLYLLPGLRGKHL